MNDKLNKFVKETGSRMFPIVKTRYSHELIVSTNFNQSWRQNLRNEYPIYKNTYPTPLLLSMDKIDEDNAIELVYAKNNWEKSIENYQKSYRLSYKSIPRINSKNITWNKNEIEVPEIVALLYKTIENDPDTHFNGLYNWYFTNGNLVCDTFNNQQLLLSATSTKQTVLNVGIINIDNINSEKISLKQESTSVFQSSILELENLKFNEDIFLGVREKKQFSLCKIIEIEQKYFANSFYKRIFDFPVTSTIINKWKPNEYISLDVAKNMQQWDINASTVQNELTSEIKLQFSEPRIDNWGMLSYLQPFNIFALDRTSFKIVDTRQNCDSSNNCLPKNFFQCDQYSLCHPSVLSANHIFLATYHSIFLLDLRNMQSVVKKWTHSMQSIPLSATSILNNNSEELVLMSSQLPSDKCFIVNTNSSNEPPISYLKTFSDSLREMKCKGKLLNPLSDLNKHANCTTTGVTLLKSGEDKVFALQGNSMGDVFVQEIIHGEYFTEDSPNIEIENVTENNDVKPLKAIAAVDMSYILKEKPKPIKKDKHSILYYTWQKSIKELNSYTDLLAPKLLESWGFQKDEIVENIDVKEVDQSLRINEWLENLPPLENNVKNENMVTEQNEENVKVRIKPKKRTKFSGF